MNNNCRGGPPWPPDWQNWMLGSRYGWPRRATPTVVMDRARCVRGSGCQKLGLVSDKVEFATDNLTRIR